MNLKESVFRELIKQGPTLNDSGNKVWDIARRNLLFLTEEQAKLFLDLRNHPRYRKTVIEKEISLLRKSIPLSLNNFQSGFNLIDMGCGNGEKALSFLKLLENQSVDLKYYAVSPNKYLSSFAKDNISSANLNFVKSSNDIVKDYYSLDEVSSIVRSSDYQNNVILLLGSILASFDINDYLFNISNSMFSGDYIILGNGLRNGERLVNLDQYKDELFHNWLKTLPKSLGFEDDELEYGARFNHVRVEMYYKIKKDKLLEFNGKKIEIKSGDEFLVAVLYKYFEKELLEFCEMYFSDVRFFKDEDEEYSLIICKK